MVCDVKTISNGGAIVERPGSRDISIEQKKRLNNAGKWPKEMHVGADKWGKDRWRRAMQERTVMNNAGKRP